MFRPWNTSLLNTNWGAVRYGIVVLSIATFLGISSFLIASDTRIQGKEEAGQNRNQMQASPILLKRGGN